MDKTPSPRVWLITGTSTGLGRALTEIVLDRGEIVIATLRQPEALAALSQKYPPERLVVLPLDITDSQQVSSVFAEVKKRFGKLDVVVNNAGINFGGETEGIPDENARKTFETNFWGTMSVTKAALSFFREVNAPGVGGRLLQMSSYLGLVGEPPAGYYVASKFALEGITEVIATELDPAWNIKITLLEPGFTISGALEKALDNWATPHPAYAGNPDLPVAKWRRGEASVEWKDTRRMMQMCYKVADLEDPPLRLVIGRDAVSAVREKIKKMTQMVDQYESWSKGLEL